MLKPTRYTRPYAEKEFLRFDETLVRESDKLDNLLTTLTGGAFIVSTSMISWFSTYNKDAVDLTFLKISWAFLIASFLSSIINLRLVVEHAKNYGEIINTKSSNTSSPIIDITEEDVKDTNVIGKRCENWATAQLIFFLIGILFLFFFFL